MMKRIIALSIIFACTWVAWLILSVVIESRTNENTPRVEGDVGALWGGEHAQNAPAVQLDWVTRKMEELTPDEKRCYVEEAERKWKADPKRKGKKFVPPDTSELRKEVETAHHQPLELEGTRLSVDLRVEHRKKGLLWFPTYTVDYISSYRIRNPLDQEAAATVAFAFPSKNAVYDNMAVTAHLPGVSGKPLEMAVDMREGQIVGTLPMPANASREIRFVYQSRGMNVWRYRFGSNVEMVKHLHVTMTTNFTEYDFPIGTISPDKKEETGSGMRFTWKKDSLVSDLDIGMVMPERINPGPLAKAMTLHAPISLFFFFFVMFMIQALREICIHPMNYFFIAASFFAFNLLFSYLLGNIPVGWAFAVASLVSVLLVVSYLYRVVGARFALLQAGVSQFLFQVLFSVAHFLEGYTGLTVTIGAIVTLAVAMQMTARIDWEAAFRASGGRRAKKGIANEPAHAIEEV